MKTIEEVLRLSTAHLRNKGIDEPRRVVEELMVRALNFKRIDLYTQFDRPLIEGELSLMRNWVKRLSSGEPLEYITGVTTFYNCEIFVDKRVLIPRPETEILVDYIVKKWKDTTKVVLDLCCGSGCIGIALKKTKPSATVFLSDLSLEALSLARQNSDANEVSVELLHGDLLKPFLGKKANLIAVNPPYVSLNEYLNLSPSVRDFEPKMALLGGDTGVEFFEKLAVELPGCLEPGGSVFLEIGAKQGALVKKIFSSSDWARKELIADWSGHDRFFFLENQ